MADGTLESKCEDLWEDFWSSHAESLSSSTINQWQEHASACAETGAYYYRQGWMYLLLQEYESASQSFNNGLAYKSIFSKDIELGLADVYFQRGARNTNADGDLEKAGKLYQRLMKTYPDHYGAYEQMGAIALITGDDEAVIRYSNQSAERGGTAYTYRNLAIAYGRRHQHEEALAAVNEAYERYDDSLADKELMLTAALAYAHTERFEESKKALSALVARNPDVKEDKEFNRVLDYIADKYRGGKDK